MTLEAIKYKSGQLDILDQLLLPQEQRYMSINDVADAWNAIKNMQVRGAPAIAIVGCLSLAVELNKSNFDNVDELKSFVEEKLKYLITSRPTAINMKNAATQMLRVANEANDLSVAQIKVRLISTAEDMLRQDLEDNRNLGDNGAAEILASVASDEKVSILTHCNTGSLATAGYGTALGIARSLAEQGRLECVYCTETRPYNQGARLTAYEMVYDHIPATLICDNMAGWLMKTHKIHAVVVGADHVAANGDFANKIGTYSLAVLAKYHNIPFLVAVPTTTINVKTKSGDEIVIEERPHDEMTHVNGQRIAAEGIHCWNPAFDVTPNELITAIVTENGVYGPSTLSSRT